MNLELIIRSYEPMLRTDRASRDLRAYVRSEWRGDASWLHRELPKVSLRSRLRGWFAGRTQAVPASRSAAEERVSEQSPVPAAPASLVDPCPHPDMQELGLSGSVVFLQCNQCGDVLVVDQDREWCFCATPSEGSADLVRA